MGYANLSQCLTDLEAQGQLRRVDVELDPYLELAAVQRRAFRAKAPALLFTRVRGTRFPMLANLFGTRERLRYIFRDSLRAVDAVLAARADPMTALRRPWRALPALPGLLRMLPRVRRVQGGEKGNAAPVLECRCALADLPRLTCWPRDGGPFITLPLVYSEDPDRPGLTKRACTIRFTGAWACIMPMPWRRAGTCRCMSMWAGRPRSVWRR